MTRLPEVIHIFEEIRERCSTTPNAHELKPNEFTAWSSIINGTSAVQVDFLEESLQFGVGRWEVYYIVDRMRNELMRKGIEFDDAQVLHCLRMQINGQLRSNPKILLWTVQQYFKHHAGSDELVQLVMGYINKHTGPSYQAAEYERTIHHLRQLIGVNDSDVPLASGDVWSDVAIAAIRQLPTHKQLIWQRIFVTCQSGVGAKPTNKWLQSCDALVNDLGVGTFKSAVLEWFALADQHGPDDGSYTHGMVMNTINVDVLRGLVWMTSRLDDDELARALGALAISAYRKIPQTGPRHMALGNACINALGAMPCEVSVSQLAFLKLKLKGNAVQKVIANALSTAAKRLKISADEIEETSVLSYGLTGIGFRREVLGEFTAELRFTSARDMELIWRKVEGKTQTAIPAVIKAGYPDALKELKQSQKDIQRMLPAQVERIEHLLIEQRKWTYEAWAKHYLNHPLVGTIARRIIWRFSQGETTSSGCWLGGHIVGNDDQPLNISSDSATVELWHPLHSSTDQVMAWRAWLQRHELRQPFKQAHREVYVLTAAEELTGTYSNRFAAHMLRQHQFHALCAIRGWKNQLRISADMECPPAIRLLPKWNLRAEFWIEAVEGNLVNNMLDSGAYRYIATDQVRFYNISSPTNLAHVGGGGYAMTAQEGLNHPLPLAQIPPLVLSEILRDVDLFVGVCSVGNDPTWADGGGNQRYADYWHSYAFGELNETAKTRHELLEVLLPRLKIAKQCELRDKFLVVRGQLHTYKIHLGSGNVLTEPNDHYLCIVPAQSAMYKVDNEKLYLPFEGDQTLAVILSKAFLLAKDADIKDTTITQQITREAS